MTMGATEEKRIKQEAAHWGMFYDVYAIDLTEQQLQIAKLYSEKFCRGCQYNFACCRNCIHLTEDGCGEEEIPVECAMFLCSFVLVRLPEGAREVLTTFVSLHPEYCSEPLHLKYPLPKIR
jgi:hypothetical protein